MISDGWNGTTASHNTDGCPDEGRQELRQVFLMPLIMMQKGPGMMTSCPYCIFLINPAESWTGEA